MPIGPFGSCGTRRRRSCQRQRRAGHGLASPVRHPSPAEAAPARVVPADGSVPEGSHERSEGRGELSSPRTHAPPPLPTGVVAQARRSQGTPRALRIARHIHQPLCHGGLLPRFRLPEQLTRWALEHSILAKRKGVCPKAAVCSSLRVCLLQRSIRLPGVLQRDGHLSPGRGSRGCPLDGADRFLLREQLAQS
jgi:hypothetical protein